jgi:excisionase family DNA binding protein
MKGSQSGGESHFDSSGIFQCHVGHATNRSSFIDIRTISYPQAAELIGCSLRTVKRLVKSGDLEITRVGKVKGVRIFVSSIERLLEERREVK